MRARLALIALAGLTAACGGGHGPTTAAVATTTTPKPRAAPFRLTVSVPTRAPKVGTAKWRYVIRAVRAGKPVRGLLTVEIVDPLGSAHVAEVGTSTRKLRNYPFDGRYRDFAQWPAASRGYPLTFRVIVRTRQGAATRNVVVRPR